MSERLEFNPEESQEEKKGVILGRDFFEFQFRFAKELAEKTGKSLDVIATKYTSVLDGHLPAERDGQSEETLVDSIYQNYLGALKEMQQALGNKPAEKRTGLFYYQYIEPEASVAVNFGGAEATETREAASLVHRRKEIENLLREVKAAHPEAKQVHSSSWLLNLKITQKFFPVSFTANLERDRDPFAWSTNTVWGQFLDSRYQLKPDVAAKFLDSAAKIDISQALSEEALREQLLAALPMPPLKASGPIEDFYKQYGIS